MASSSRPEDNSSAVTRHVEFEASIFSALETNMPNPLSLSLPPRVDVKHVHEKRTSRHDSKVSHRSSIHRSSSLVFRTLPPLRRLPSLQVPSLTDITNPHGLSTPRRSLHQISETAATTYKLKLPLTLIHPNSPYVPWEAPERQKILCPSSEPRLDGGEDQDPENALPDPEQKKTKKHIWTALKSAPKSIKTKCQRLLNTRSKDSSLPSSTSTLEEDPIEPDPLVDSNEQTIAYTLDASLGVARTYSPTASFRSTESNALAAWLAERQRKFLEKDCESAKIMSIEDYERLGSWVKHGEHPFSSRSSYHFSFADGDTVSSIHILESDHDLTGRLTNESPTSPFMRAPSSPSRTAFGPKRIAEEDRLSRLVHRSSLRSYIAERTPSVANVPTSS